MTKRGWWQYMDEPCADRTITVHEAEPEPSRLLDKDGRRLGRERAPPGFHSPRQVRK